MVQILAVSPVLALFPFFTKGFYTTWIGYLMMLMTWLAILWGIVRQREARMLFFLYLLGLVPILLLGYPQSRYFYLTSFFLGCGVFAVLKDFRKEAFAIIVYFLLLCIHAIGAWDKKVEWELANVQTNRLREEIAALAVKSSDPLLIVNLPDRYGSEGIWLPYMWRNGMSYFSIPFSCVFTPDCPNLYQGANMQILERPEILDLCSHHEVYEVIRVKEDRGWDYRLVPFAARQE